MPLLLLTFPVLPKFPRVIASLLLLASPDITVVFCAAVNTDADVIYAGDHSAVARVTDVAAFLTAVDVHSANGVPIFLASLLLLSALPLFLLLWGSLLLMAFLMLLRTCCC